MSHLWHLGFLGYNTLQVFLKIYVWDKLFQIKDGGLWGVIILLLDNCSVLVSTCYSCLMKTKFKKPQPKSIHAGVMYALFLLFK